MLKATILSFFISILSTTYAGRGALSIKNPALLSNLALYSAPTLQHSFLSMKAYPRFAKPTVPFAFKRLMKSLSTEFVSAFTGKTITEQLCLTNDKSPNTWETTFKSLVKGAKQTYEDNFFSVQLDSPSFYTQKNFAEMLKSSYEDNAANRHAADYRTWLFNIISDEALYAGKTPETHYDFMDNPAHFPLYFSSAPVASIFVMLLENYHGPKNWWEVVHVSELQSFYHTASKNKSDLWTVAMWEILLPFYPLSFFPNIENKKDFWLYMLAKAHRYVEIPQKSSELEKKILSVLDTTTWSPSERDQYLRELK